jgi:hypothetical protein
MGGPGLVLRQASRRRAPAYGEAGYRRYDLDAYDTVDGRLAGALKDAWPGFATRRIWEPAAGRGVLSDRLRALGADVVVETDLVPRHARVAPGDFFCFERLPPGCDAIVTNPPFADLDKFARHAVNLAELHGDAVALLIRLEWITAKCRRDLTSTIERLIVPRFRPKWVEAGPASPRFNFAWAVWDGRREPGPSCLLFG